ncbi:substrate-binding domain-containing protein, partial [Phytoactinopolyspora endophytica]|uniref:substrate-binding domain-containing protein n=1 Tax=Phytoactinopolyspora endophytica TaxID=1642495 RepID=UPI0013EC8B3A
DGGPAGEHFCPPLTTMRADPHEHGQQAVQLILAHLDRQVVQTPRLIETRLIVRESTAPPPASRARQGARRPS